MTTHVGNFVVFGDIELKWLACGGLAGPLKQPVSNEAPTFDGVGREQKFQGGFISWHPDPGVRAHTVWGLIGTRWVAIGREKFGYPVSDESDFPAGGKYSTFRALHLAGHPEASIVWKPGMASAWEVYGAIRQSWINTGSVTGPLHYPVDQERPAFDNTGRYQHFEGGILSWHPGISGGPFIVWGLIGKRWLELGREQFGYPVTNEMTFPDGGKYSTFRAMQLAGHPEASIVWKPGAAAAWEVYGAIRDKWIGTGSAGGALGYPVQNEMPAGGEGRYQLFEHGVISWYPQSEARVGERRPWAVILCRFEGSPPDPALEGPIEKFYRDAFTPGSGGLVEYWRDVSLGAIDIIGSRVFGWVEVDLPRANAGGTPNSAPPGPGRSGLIDHAISAVKQTAGNDALNGLLGPIAVYTQNWSKDGAPPNATWQTPGWFPYWIDGSADGTGRIALTPPHNGNITAHEMGHVYGMGHDVGPDLMTSSDYSDPCCIMSQNGSFVPPGWGINFGPAVCLPHLVQRGWMFGNRLYRDAGGWLSQPDGITLPLAPVSRPSARANLGIRLACSQGAASWDYYLEYMIPVEWDQGVPGAPYLFVRRIVSINGAGDRPAYLGALKVPAAVGTTAEFVEPSGNVRFRAELTDLPGPILKVNAKKL